MLGCFTLAEKRLPGTWEYHAHFSWIDVDGWNQVISRGGHHVSTTERHICTVAFLLYCTCSMDASTKKIERRRDYTDADFQQSCIWQCHSWQWVTYW